MHPIELNTSSHPAPRCWLASWSSKITAGVVLNYARPISPRPNFGSMPTFDGVAKSTSQALITGPSTRISCLVRLP